jgi:hypothetical protein
MREKRPSAPMVLSIIAVVLALAGTSVAGVATISVLSKKEKKQTKRIADNEISRLAPSLSVKSASSADTASTAGTASSANTAGNASQLGGIGPGGFVQGGGRQVPVRAYVDSGGSATLIDASGVGRLTASCANSGQDVTLAYQNTSGAFQLGSGSRVNQGLSSTVEVSGTTLASGGTPVVLTGSSAGSSDAHVFTFDAASITATGAAGFSFRGTGWTKPSSANRCVVQGVATIG